MLNPEEKTIVQNIKSLLQQIEQIETGEEVKDEKEEDLSIMKNQKAKKRVVRKEDMPMEDEYIEDEMVEEADGECSVGEDDIDLEKAMKAINSLKKFIAKADDESTTGSDDAETRLEDLPEIDEENLDEVTKAILSLAKGKKKKVVAKSNIDRRLAGIEKAITDLAMVTKSVVTDQEDVSKAVSNILEGIGISKVVKSQTPATRTRPVGNRSVQKSRDDVRAEIRAEVEKELSVRKSDSVQRIDNTQDVRKSLGSILPTLFSK